jgi:ATP-dependent DNA helicase UvrD/PcrA
MTSSLAGHDQIIAGLNPAQREAVLQVEGPLLVLAGAGSGKTRVLTTRIAHLIERHGVDPRAILAVTFTNKAAGEMRSRIAALLGAEPAGMWVGTFHAIGARMVRMHAPLVGRTAQFTIYDEDDLLALVKRLMERQRLSTKDLPPQAVVAAISDAKNGLVAPDEFTRLAMDARTRDIAGLYQALEPAMRQANAAAFDDLLTLPVELLSGHDTLLRRYRDRFRYVLVDEYQDTNRAQYRFVQLLSGAAGNVAVVGDDDQSIYGWRGADIRNILDFERDFPGAHVVRLEENYRSTPEILALANAAISANTERRGKTLRSTRPTGDRVTVVAALDERDEAAFVVEEVQGRRFAVRGRPLSDFAVLYRTNSQSRAMEEAMRRHAIPYRLVGAVRFYDRREIRDLMAYLKLVANPADDESFRRAVGVPRRGVGDTTVELLGEHAYRAGVPMLAAATDPGIVGGLRPAARAALAEFSALIARLRTLATEAPVDEVLRTLVEAVRYDAHLRADGPDAQDRLENVRELITSAAETVADDLGEIGLTPLDHFLQRATLVAAVDSLDGDADAVVLMTLHNAKGLEFPVVFITGLEEGLFPLARNRDTIQQLEEERRLFYVGITRAEEVLFLSHARTRRRNGEQMASMSSSFVRDLPADLYVSRATVRLRGSGQPLEGHQRFGSERFGEDRTGWRPTPSERRPGSPVARTMPREFDEDVSQDLPDFVPGERVRHARFGDGTIAELAGFGREAKVTIDFDDETIGRKRLVVAFAGLERGIG